jgi:hypothetical protein
MPASIEQREREATAAMQTAAQALLRAIELAARAEYGDQITQSLTEAQRAVVFALGTTHGRN